MRTDNGYIAPHNEHAKTHSKRQPDTFLYSLEYRGENVPTPKWRGNKYYPFMQVHH